MTSTCPLPSSQLVSKWADIKVSDGAQIIENSCNPQIPIANIQGTTLVSCPQNGEWSTSVPSCIPSDPTACTTAIDVGFKTTNSFQFGSGVSFGANGSISDVGIDASANVCGVGFGKGTTNGECGAKLSFDPIVGKADKDLGQLGCKYTGTPVKVDVDGKVGWSSDIGADIGGDAIPPKVHVSAHSSLNFNSGWSASPRLKIPYAGCATQCTRTGYNAPSALCCAANGSKTSYSQDGKVVDPLTNGSLPTTCDPLQRDWNNSACDSGMEGLCSTPENAYGNLDNTNFKLWGKGGVCNTYASTTLSTSGAFNTISQGIASLNEKYPLDKSENWENNSDAINAWDGILNAVSNSASSGANGALKNACANFTREELGVLDGSGNNKVDSIILNACGCHLPTSEYSKFSGIIQEGSYNSCDPLCLRPGSIQNFANGVPQKCSQSNCIIDDVTIDIIDSNVSGDINLKQMCPGKACYFSDINIFNEASGKPKVNIQSDCSSCFIYHPRDPYNPTPVDCKSGKPTTPTGMWGRIVQFFKDHRSLAIGILAVVLFIITAGIILFIHSRGESALAEKEKLYYAYEYGSKYGSSQ